MKLCRTFLGSYHSLCFHSATLTNLLLRHVRVCEVTIRCRTTSHHPAQSLSTAVLIQGLETEVYRQKLWMCFHCRLKLDQGSGPVDASEIGKLFSLLPQLI